MSGKVTVWKMSESERLAYIAKHPIKPFQKEFTYISDYKWRSEKATEASVKAREVK